MYTNPILKKNYYVASVIENILYELIDVSFKNINTTRNNNILLDCYLNKDDINFFHEIDNLSCNDLIENNNKWFNNNLSSDEIKDLFHSSYCIQNSIISLKINNKTKIKYDDKLINSHHFLELLKNFTNHKKKYLINIKLWYEGIYIYNDHTKNKWDINEIIIYNNEDDIDFEERDEILNHWRLMVKEAEKNLDNKIENIENLKKNINSKYIELTKSKDLNIKELKDLIQNIIF